MKVLVLSYHFPPFNVIASYRAKAYADYFPKYGIETTVLTHPWTENEVDVIEEVWKGSRIIRIPRTKSSICKLIRLTNHIPILRILVNYVVVGLGFLDGNNVQLDFFFLYKRFLIQHLKEESYDLVLPIFSPYHHIKLAHYIKGKYNIPFAPDFRDLYDNRILDSSFTPNMNERILITLRRYYLKRWLKNSEFVVSTSQQWADHLAALSDTVGVQILNGYEAEYFEGYKRREVGRFVISSIGTIHRSQDWRGYLRSIEIFIANLKREIKLNFIGVDERFRCEILSWHKALTFKDRVSVEVKPRIPKESVYRYFEETAVLLLPALRGNPGMYSGKTFELLATKVPIFYYPDDKDVISQLINVENAGFTFTSTEDMVSKFVELYQQWLKKGITTSNSNPQAVTKYSRENQVKRLAQKIQEWHYER